MSTTRNGPRAGSRSAVAPTNDSCASSPPDSSSGRTPMASVAASKKSSRLAASRAAEVAVMRMRSAPWPPDDLAELAQHRHGALDGGRVEPPGRVDAGPQPGDAHQSFVGHEGRSRAIGRRFGHEQADRVGADVDRRHAVAHGPTSGSCVGDPRADGVVAAGQVPGVVGVQALDARARAPDATRGAGPDVVVGRQGGVALGPVAVVGSPPARPDRPRASARRTPPAASSRPMAARSVGSTSQ